jgi:hypothetical protein
VDTIGPRGGTVMSADGHLVLDVLEDALDEEVEIFVEETDCEAAFGTCYRIEPVGTVLDVPAIVSLAYDVEDIGDTDPASLAIAIQKGDSWEPLPDRVVDLENGAISGTTMFLSTLALGDRHEG